MKIIPTIIGILLLVLTIYTALGETSNPTQDEQWGTWGHDKYNSFYIDAETPWTGAYQNYTFGAGSIDGVAVWDLDEDGFNEIIILASSSLRILNYTLQQKASISTGSGFGYPEIQSEGCTPLDAIIILAGTSIRKYCWNGTALYLKANKTVSDIDDRAGMKCDDDHCYFATITGWKDIELTTTGFGTETNHADSEIGNYLVYQNTTYGSLATDDLYPYYPGIGDTDGDLDDDIAFYCAITGESPPAQVTGVKVFDISGATTTPCTYLGNGTTGTYTTALNNANYQFMKSILVTDGGNVITAINQYTAYPANPYLIMMDSSGTLVNTYTIAGGSQVMFRVPMNNRDTGRFLVPGHHTTDGQFTWRFTSALSMQQQETFNTGGTMLWSDGVHVKDMTPEFLTSPMQYVTSGGRRELSQTASYQYEQWSRAGGCTNIFDTVVAADVDKNGYIDFIVSCDGETLLYRAASAPATPPVPPPPTNTPKLINTDVNTSTKSYDGTGKFVTVGIHPTGNQSLNFNWTINYADGIDMNASNVMLVFYYDSTVESTHANINDIRSDGGINKLAWGPFGSPSNYGNHYFSNQLEGYALRFKWYSWYTNYSTNFNSYPVDGGPPEGYIIFSDASTGVVTIKTVLCENPSITIPGPLVYVQNYDYLGEHVVIKYANSGGNAQFIMPVGTYTFGAEDPDYTMPNTTTCTTGSTCNLCMTFQTNITLTVKVYDSQTFNPINGASVEVYRRATGYDETKLTNANGNANFTIHPLQTYEIYVTKTGYYAEGDSGSWWTDSIQPIYLSPSITGSANAVLTIKSATTLLPIFNAYVTLSDPLSGDYKQGYTNSDGQVDFNNLLGSTVYRVRGIRNGYADGTFSLETISNTTITETYLLTPSSYTTPSTVTINGTITETWCDGLWIGAMKNVRCTEDTDCITGQCTPMGTCSTFNWTWCDANGRQRNQRCMAKATTDCGLNNTSNWMLDNFLWMLVILIVIVAFAFIAISFRRR